MGLSEDQKAMLRLLAQREQGYDDIAALMGLSVAQVRERVKDALDQLETEKGSGSDEPRPAGPVVEDDSSSSQAAGEEPPSTPPAGGDSAEETAPVQERAPEPLPSPAQPRPAAQVPREVAPAAKRQSSGPPKLSLPDSAGARAAIAAGVVALVVLVAVLVVGGGDEGSDSATTANSGPAVEGEPTSGNVKRLTKAVLKPVGESGATGVAVFGRLKNTLALQVEAEGLTATGKGASYTVWLSESPRKMLPLASTAVGEDGRIGTQFEVPTEVLAYLANETFDQIAITQTDDAALKASLNKATGEKKAPEYTGTEVLRGTITGPIIGAARK